MRGLSQTIEYKGKIFHADIEYDKHLSHDTERAKERIRELKSEGYEAIYRTVLFTEGTETGIQVYRYPKEIG